MQFREFRTALLVLTASVGCTSNPVAPTPPDAPPPGATIGLGCALELDGYRCEATLWGSDGRKDITGLASWSTSDPSIATVNSVGFVTVFRRGEVAIRARYGSVDGFIVMDVEIGGSRRYYRALSGWIVDAQTEVKIPGTTVEIVAGANAGRATTSGSDGSYQLYDLEPGAFTVRFSKAGYRPAERFFVLTGETFNSLDARLMP